MGLVKLTFLHQDHMNQKWSSGRRKVPPMEARFSRSCRGRGPNKNLATVTRSGVQGSTISFFISESESQGTFHECDPAPAKTNHLA